MQMLVLHLQQWKIFFYWTSEYCIANIASKTEFISGNGQTGQLKMEIEGQVYVRDTGCLYLSSGVFYLPSDGITGDNRRVNRENNFDD